MQARVGLEITTELMDKLEVELFGGQRWNHNLNTSDKTILQPSLTYEVFDFLSVGAGYRMAWAFDYDKTTRFHQRFHTNVALKHKIDRFKLRYRSRVQYGFYDYNASDNFSSNALVHRAKFEVSYTPFGTRISPYAASEFFNQLNDENSYIKTRYLFGAAYSFTRLSLDVFYQIDKELNTANPMTEFIIGLTLGYEF